MMTSDRESDRANAVYSPDGEDELVRKNERVTRKKKHGAGACLFLARGQIVFSVWVGFAEHKWVVGFAGHRWVILGERRGR
jgi:hypothetical protein